jgi:hypothetical protein
MGDVLVGRMSMQVKVSEGAQRKVRAADCLLGTEVLIRGTMSCTCDYWMLQPSPAQGEGSRRLVRNKGVDQVAYGCIWLHI